MGSDSWTSDYDKAESLLSSVRSAVDGKQLTGQEIALTRGRISQLNSLVTYLQQSISISNESNDSINNPKKSELKSRASAVLKLSSDVERCKSKFYNLITGSTQADIETGLEINEIEHTNRAQAQSEHDQLDHILGTATNLKEIGYEINDEIGVHLRLLEEIDAREDELLMKQRKNERLLREWINSKTSPLAWLWALVAVLFFTLLYVLIW